MVLGQPSIRVENFRHYPRPIAKTYNVFDDYDECKFPEAALNSANNESVRVHRGMHRYRCPS